MGRVRAQGGAIEDPRDRRKVRADQRVMMPEVDIGLRFAGGPGIAGGVERAQVLQTGGGVVDQCPDRCGRGQVVERPQHEDG